MRRADIVLKFHHFGWRRLYLVPILKALGLFRNVVHASTMAGVSAIGRGVLALQKKRALLFRASRYGVTFFTEWTSHGIALTDFIFILIHEYAL